MTPADLVAIVILVALIAYTLTGGADFGGGIWDLFASRGDAGKRQREAIAKAIAPIWEANHVWLIVIIVLLFVGFPRVFSAISTALHIPLAIMLVGIVLRGSAFVFRAYGPQSDGAQTSWGRVFAISSLLTPVFLGITLGAVASGAIVFNADGMVQTDFVSEWLAPFPLAVGGFVTAQFAFLASVYLIFETNERELRESFRKRALISGTCVGGFALLALALAQNGAPIIIEGLRDKWWSLPFHALTAAAASNALWALWVRRYGIARLSAMVQVTLIVVGFGFAMLPWLLPGQLSIRDAAAPDSVLVPVLVVLAVGLAIVIPAFWYLYRVFKAREAE